MINPIASIGRLSALSTALLLVACSVPVREPVLPAVHYRPVAFSALPGWASDDLHAGFNAWKAGCPRLKNHPIWGPVCIEAAGIADDTNTIRTFLENRFTAFQLSNDDNSNIGFVTGYYEPVYPGSLTRSVTAQHPLYGQPDDLITVALEDIYPELKGKRLRGKLVGKKVLPYPDRAEIVRKGINAPVLAWLTDPLDVQFMQVQGSGRVKLVDGRELRLGYSDQNGRPYQPVGRWLVQQGELPASDVSMQSIRTWASAHPDRIENLLDSNPSYVFFRTLPASTDGPIGSLGIPLTPERSIAVDTATIALGSMVFVSTTRPDSGMALQKLVAAQDTGGAIKGRIRADYFWGTGAVAGELAGKMKQSGSLWLLWPKGSPLPH